MSSSSYNLEVTLAVVTEVMVIYLPRKSLIYTIEHISMHTLEISIGMCIVNEYTYWFCNILYKISFEYYDNSSDLCCICTNVVHCIPSVTIHADTQRHQCWEELDHHFPAAHRHPLTLPARRQTRYSSSTSSITETDWNLIMDRYLDY